MIALSCLALAAACWAWLPADPSRRAAAWLAGSLTPRRQGGRPWLSYLGLLWALGMVAVLAPQLLVWVVPGLVIGVTAGWLIAQSRADKVRRAAADEVVLACQAVATQLRVGDIPAQALMRVAADSALLQPVAATQAIGGDVPAALRAVAGAPGCAGLLSLSRSWQLCQTTGAPLAGAATRVAEGLRSDAAAERMVAAELAAPRATGRMLAALPLLGIGLGFVGGGNPIDFLGGTLVGRICLAAAICLVCGGLVWTTLLGRMPDLEGADP